MVCGCEGVWFVNVRFVDVRVCGLWLGVCVVSEGVWFVVMRYVCGCEGCGCTNRSCGGVIGGSVHVGEMKWRCECVGV